MEEVHGRTLLSLIRSVHGASGADGWRPGPEGHTLRRLLDLLHRVAETIAFAHARGAVHRDLRPECVMVGDFGEVRVLDWGLARALPSGDAPTAGTPWYLAPEQAAGRAVGVAADVYALGALLYTILCGRPPFAGLTPDEVLKRLATEPPIPLDQLAG